jgi:hypothetical protein
MINFYNEKLAPQMLCKLIHNVVPYRYHHPVIFSYGKQHMPNKHERSSGVLCRHGIYLNLEAIAFYGGKGSCSISAGVWREMLRVGFHEFGHLALKHMCLSQCRYDYDWEFRSYIEKQANDKAEEWLKKVLAYDDRLYQPDFLGIVDIIRRRHRRPLKEIPRGSYFCERLKSLRCHRTGGQLSVTDVVANLNIYYHEHKRWAINLIHKLGDDIARKYKDSAGRLHHFWVWGDLSIIANRLKKVEPDIIAYLGKREQKEKQEKRDSDNEMPF